MRFIYTITNRVNGKIYVGQTKNPERRWNEHCHNSERMRYQLYFAMTKYGNENFDFKVIEECVDGLADYCEQFWIKHYDTFDSPHGYNMTRGGSACHDMSKEARAKMSQAKLGKRAPRSCLTDAQAREIYDFAIAHESMTVKEIAKEFKLTNKITVDLLYGHTYKHVLGDLPPARKCHRRPSIEQCKEIYDFIMQHPELTRVDAARKFCVTLDVVKEAIRAYRPSGTRGWAKLLAHRPI